MDAYMYQAAYLCAKCAERVIAAIPLNKQPRCTCTATRLMHVEGYCPSGRGSYDPNEVTYDSGDFPKGPFLDGGGEADSPNHCDSCQVFLENPLTDDGVAYVRQTLSDGFGRAAVMDEWREFYADQLAQKVCELNVCNRVVEADADIYCRFHGSAQ